MGFSAIHNFVVLDYVLVALFSPPRLLQAMVPGPVVEAALQADIALRSDEFVNTVVQLLIFRHEFGK